MVHVGSQGTACDVHLEAVLHARPSQRARDGPRVVHERFDRRGLRFDRQLTEVTAVLLKGEA